MAPAKVTLQSIMKKSKNLRGPAMEISENDTISIEPDELNQIPWLTDSIRSYIATASTLKKGNDDLISRIELDTHANMAVVGRNAYILSYTGATA